MLPSLIDTGTAFTVQSAIYFTTHGQSPVTVLYSASTIQQKFGTRLTLPKPAPSTSASITKTNEDQHNHRPRLHLSPSPNSIQRQTEQAKGERQNWESERTNQPNMSEPIPESIPTSSDPRSKRALKKRALTPSSAHAAHLDALFQKPEQEIRLPASSASSSLSTVPHGQPPEIVANVQGSSAGAGSGEFHVYKASRRREYERLRAMDEEVQREKDVLGWEVERREREERDREKTRRNREKREKLKMRKGKGGGNKGGKTEAGEVEGPEKGKGGKIKARVDLGPRVEGGKDEERSVGEGLPEADIVGVVIHDDD